MSRHTPTPEGAINKWKVLEAIRTARKRFGLKDRSVTLFEALLSFHPGPVLAGDNLVVFPSNAKLAHRANGMAESTLRKHLAALVDAGLVLRRDSPNRKRYPRKDRAGKIIQAYGVDLSPLVARAQEFERLAEAVRVEQRAVRYAKERISLAKLDIVKMIASGIEEQNSSAEGQGIAIWEGFRERCNSIIERLPRTCTIVQIEPIAEALSALAEEVNNLWKTQVKNPETGGNGSQNERHIENSKPETPIDFEPPHQESRVADAAKLDLQPRRLAETNFRLDMVLQACPKFALCANGGVSSWNDFLAAAVVACNIYEVSPSAWEAARTAMGERSAAIAVAAILQRGAKVKISSLGGYLRKLTRKAEANPLAVEPMLLWLLGAHPR